MSRTPYDGQPYYCRLCGLGWNEFMACEETSCTLEDESSAKARMRTKDAARPKTKMVKDLLPGDKIILDDNTFRTVDRVVFGFALRLKGDSSTPGAVIYWKEGDWSITSRLTDCHIHGDLNG